MPLFKTIGRVLLLTAWLTSTAFAQSTSPKRVLLIYEHDGAVPGLLVFEESLVQDLHAAMGSNLEFYLHGLPGRNSGHATPQCAALS